MDGKRVSYTTRTTIESVRRDTTDTLASGPSDTRVHITRHKEIRIRNGEIGYGYERIFGKLLKGDVHTVLVEEPYIRTEQQLYNFACFCELLAHKCKNLRKIICRTGTNDQNMAEIRKSLLQHNIVLEVTYDFTMHDRRVCLSNGWVIKIGRGLNYFKTPGWQYYRDLNTAPCHPCTIDIYFVNGIFLE